LNAMPAKEKVLFWVEIKKRDELYG
jgi:hypothetical protein